MFNHLTAWPFPVAQKKQKKITDLPEDGGQDRQRQKNQEEQDRQDDAPGYVSCWK